MNITCIFFGVVFIAAGLILAFGGGYKRLPAWKNMSDEEKGKIKIVPLCRNAGEIIMLNGIIFLMKGLWQDFFDHAFTGVMIAWLIVAGLDVWYITKSSRYLNK